MTQDDGWVEKETSSDIVKLGDQDGQVASIQGVFKGFREGKYGQLYVFEDADGKPLVLGGNAALEDSIEETDKGWMMRIDFTGWEESAGGRRYKTFSIFRKPGPEMGAAGDDAPPHTDDDAPKEDDDDSALPF